MAHDIEFFKAKTTLASTALAAALGLVLGLMSTPATAHDCARHNDPNHKHCDTGGGGGGGGGEPPALFDPVIVFETTGNKDRNDRLGVVDLDGNFAVILRSDLYWARSPHWMPDGREIVFASDWGGTPGIYRLQVVDDFGALITDGAPVLILAANVGIVANPLVAALGSGDLLLAYSAVVLDPQPGNYEIFLARLNPDGTVAALDNITNTPTVGEVYQTLSPGGLSIAYNTEDGFDNEDIVVVDISIVDGIPVAGPETSLVLEVEFSELRLANSVQQYPLFHLDYSNATNEIVLSLNSEDSDRNLWIIPVDAPEEAAPLMLTPGIAEILPSWSPDDSQLVYMQSGGPRCSQGKGRSSWSLVIRNSNGDPFAGGCEAKLVLSFGGAPDWRP